MRRACFEEWRPVPGCEGSYEVSDMGNVRSVTRIVVVSMSKGKDVRRVWKGRRLTPHMQGCGHLAVRLSLGSRDAQPLVAIHKLVMLAFVGPCPEGCEILHWDDVKINNKLENLRYGTRLENMQDRIRNGRTNRGQTWTQRK